MVVILFYDRSYAFMSHEKINIEDGKRTALSPCGSDGRIHVAITDIRYVV